MLRQQPREASVDGGERHRLRDREPDELESRWRSVRREVDCLSKIYVQVENDSVATPIAGVIAGEVD